MASGLVATVEKRSGGELRSENRCAVRLRTEIADVETQTFKPRSDSVDNCMQTKLAVS
eukprot:CAMPEP_0177700300 /NCGR_PEP_ID=MMETSP0484_2-20121128/6024_1 /TAXON_ID=354590 /ORGANISM="Rhodomonas lens, Strain RHODO" /LENGTH=57 /DNA_ID=CAMNT_0019211497 /DNA_START=121 /DNA_END=291 /DNA_ORIENTATION=-